MYAAEEPHLLRPPPCPVLRKVVDPAIEPQASFGALAGVLRYNIDDAPQSARTVERGCRPFDHLDPVDLRCGQTFPDDLARITRYKRKPVNEHKDPRPDPEAIPCRPPDIDLRLSNVNTRHVAEGVVDCYSISIR